MRVMFERLVPTTSLNSLGEADPVSLATSRQRTWKECTESARAQTGSKKSLKPAPQIRSKRTMTVPSIRMSGSALAIRGVLESTLERRRCPFMDHK